MIRFLSLLVAAVCAIQCTTADAQRQSRRGYRSEPSLFGFSFGIGNYSPSGYYPQGTFDPYAFDGRAYDPYRYGSFRAPDLLDDPYFRERHRFDSRYPGRYRGRIDRRVPAVQQSRRAPTHPYEEGIEIDTTLVAPADLANELSIASRRLSRSLSAQQHGDAWQEYLRPHRISEHIRSGNTAALRELIANYDGVVANPKLRNVMATDGFAATRHLLRQYVETLSGSK
jgi:hypothetical protein